MLAGGINQAISGFCRLFEAMVISWLAQTTPVKDQPVSKPAPTGVEPKLTGYVNVLEDPATIGLLGIILGLLTAAFIAGRILRSQPETTINPLVVRVFNQRIRAWWMMSRDPYREHFHWTNCHGGVIRTCLVHGPS